MVSEKLIQASTHPTCSLSLSLSLHSFIMDTFLAIIYINWLHFIKKITFNLPEERMNFAAGVAFIDFVFTATNRHRHTFIHSQLYSNN